MKKERWLKMKVPTRLRPWLRALVRDGLHGSTEEEAAIRLIEEGLRRVVTDEYLQKVRGTRNLLADVADRGSNK